VERLNLLITKLKTLIVLTEDYADHSFANPTKFQDILVVSFRRNMIAVKAIYHLLTAKQGDSTVYSSEAISILRKTIENYITILYIMFKGKEKYSLKAEKFYIVEKKREYDLAVAMIENDDEKNRLNNVYKDILIEFDNLSPDVKGTVDRPRRTWAGIDVDTMMDLLIENEFVDKQSLRIIKTTYYLCCQNLHFSIVNIAHYSKIDRTKKYLFFNTKVLVMTTIDIYTELVCLLLKEFNSDDPTLEKIKMLREETYLITQT
jgi:hypothetical protein